MKKLSITADEQFRDGDKVYLKPGYESQDRKEQFTLSITDEERRKGRIEDKDGRGWNISFSQITKKRPK